MNNLITAIQNKLEKDNIFQYIDYDWGQLSFDQPSVKFPCCLIDVPNGEFSNMGKDFSKSKVTRQNAQLTIKITVADLRLTNTSSKAHTKQKAEHWKILDLTQNVKTSLHGWAPFPTSSPLILQSFSKDTQDNSISSYSLFFTVTLFNL